MHCHGLMRHTHEASDTSAIVQTQIWSWNKMRRDIRDCGGGMVNENEPFHFLTEEEFSVLPQPAKVAYLGCAILNLRRQQGPPYVFSDPASPTYPLAVSKAIDTP